MRNRTTSKALTLAALAAAALPASSADAAGPKYQKERFEVRILGEQVTTWGTLSDDHAESCRTKVVGSGKEQLIFRTKRPHTLTVYATKSRGTYVYGNLLVDGLAIVNRNGYEDVTTEDPCPPVAEGDPDGGPGEQPPAPDCGEKEAPIGLELSFTRKTVELRSDQSQGRDDLFSNCPVRGTAFAELLTIGSATGGGAKVIRGRLLLSDLMNRKKRNFQVTARGSLTDIYADTNTKTTISWEMRLKRLGPKKGR
jgi:hypothetical protein